MIHVTRQTDYAVRIVLHLACQAEGAHVPIPEIAAQRHLPLPFVRRLVSSLVGAGILQTVRGSAGGVGLAKPASEISLLDVVVAIEGPICPSPCVEQPHGCPLGKSCPVRSVWTDAGRVLENHLHQTRFSALAGASGHREAHREVRSARGPSFPKPRNIHPKGKQPWTS